MDKLDSDNLIIIPCPALFDYKEQPKDQSLCTLENCPLCGKKMWLSKKKKGWIRMATMMEKEIFLSCYTCLLIEVANNPKFKDIFSQAGAIKI